MLATAALVAKNFTKIKSQPARILSKFDRHMKSQGYPDTNYIPRHFTNDPVSLKLYFMYFYFSSMAKKPKQTFSIVFSSRECLGFDVQRDHLLFKENLEKVQENFEKKGFKTKLQAMKRSSVPTYKFTVSTRENFR